MTVSTTISSLTFPGNGVTQIFPCDFRIFDETDVRVSLVDQTTGADTPLILNTHYTISGAGDDAGFMVATLSPVASGVNLYVRRALAYTQPTDFTNQGAFFPTMHEDAMDRLEMQIQMLADENDRALRLPGGLSDTDGQISKLVPLAPLVVNANGTGVESGSTELTGDMLLRANLAETDPGKGAWLVGFIQSGIGSVARTLLDKVRERWSLADKPVVGDRSTNNLTAVNNAFSDAPPLTDLYVPEGDYVVSAMPTNNYGARPVGPGKILVPATNGGYDQYNSYRNTRPIATGKEYLWAPFNVMQATNRAIRCYLYGDSTVEGGFNFIDWAFFLQQYLPDAVAAKGVRNYFSVTNRGVGGSNLSTWNPTPDIGVNSATYADLVILKCGINDGSFPIGTRLDTFRTNLRAGLAAIRAVNGGGVGGTAILLVGPNATIDRHSFTRKDEWYEELRGIFEAAARDYQCAYFDTYAYLQDAAREDWAMARWINDDTAGDGLHVGLHPRNVGQSWIWGAIVDWMFGDTEIMRWKANTFTSKSVYFGHPYAKQIPDWYPNNYAAGITVEVAQTADGWPFNGILTTHKSAEGPARQELRSLDGNDVVFTRTSDPGNFWGAWRGWFSGLTYANGWTDFGSSYGVGKAMVNEQQQVFLSGLIKPGTTTANTTMFTLPAEMRPANQKMMPAISDAGVCTVEVLATGDVRLRSGTPASYLSLAGVNFFKG